MDLKITISKTEIVLDSALSSSRNSIRKEQNTKPKQRRTVVGQSETDILNWLRAKHGLRSVSHRHTFTIEGQMVLTSNPFSSVHLLEYWSAETSATSTEDLDGVECELVIVKIAKNPEGQGRLVREATALQSLQGTDRVPKIWKPEHGEDFLRRGILTTLYHPVPPPQDSGHETTLSLSDLEEMMAELASAVDAVHKSGRMWLGLKPGHILFHLFRKDPRDRPTPLRITGMENSRSILDSNDRDVLKLDSIWGTVPELKQKSTCVTPAADMYTIGLLLSSCLSRTTTPPFPQGYCNDPESGTVSHRDSLVASFNSLVYDDTKKISENHFLLDLLGDLLHADPLLRPTAEQMLLRTQNGSTNHVQQYGNSFVREIPGYIQESTKSMVFPALMVCHIVDDQYKDRPSENFSISAALKTPQGKILAEYSGRPVSKEFLRWLRFLNLHTHALSDGGGGCYDGRRKCNGIFDLAFYESIGKVFFSSKFSGQIMMLFNAT
jgi:hypothetical protein